MKLVCNHLNKIFSVGLSNDFNSDVRVDDIIILYMILDLLIFFSFIMSNITTYLNASRCALSWIQLGGLDIENCSAVMNLLIDLTCFVYW